MIATELLFNQEVNVIIILSVARAIDLFAFFGGAGGGFDIFLSALFLADNQRFVFVDKSIEVI